MAMFANKKIISLNYPQNHSYLKHCICILPKHCICMLPVSLYIQTLTWCFQPIQAFVNCYIYSYFFTKNPNLKKKIFLGGGGGGYSKW